MPRRQMRSDSGRLGSLINVSVSFNVLHAKHREPLLGIVCTNEIDQEFPSSSKKFPYIKGIQETV